MIDDAKPKLRVLLAAPRGFCAGVLRAIEIVERLLERYGPPIYVRHEIVHNKHVVVWYWLCFHHFPRSEDWLQQPVVWRSFELMPRDFLDSSPLKATK